MARPRKKAEELTTQEALRKLFPPEVRKEAKEEAKKAEGKPSKEKG